MLKQLISKSATSHHNMCHYRPIHSRLYKDTEKENHYPKALTRKQVRQNKPSEVSPKKDVERIYNKQYLQSPLVYTSVSSAFQFSLHTRHSSSTPSHSVIAPKPQKFFHTSLSRLIHHHMYPQLIFPLLPQKKTTTTYFFLLLISTWVGRTSWYFVLNFPEDEKLLLK